MWPRDVRSLAVPRVQRKKTKAAYVQNEVEPNKIRVEKHLSVAIIFTFVRRGFRVFFLEGGDRSRMCETNHDVSPSAISQS